jgi:hypothetical protein
MNATFPVITAADAGRYIATARLTPNAVALRIRQMLAPSGPHLIRRCMYCGADFGRTPCVPAMHGKVSHGVCQSEACLARIAQDFGETLQRGGVGESGSGETDPRDAGHAASLTARDCGVRAAPAEQRTTREGALGLRSRRSLSTSGADEAPEQVRASEAV